MNDNIYICFERELFMYSLISLVEINIYLCMVSIFK